MKRQLKKSDLERSKQRIKEGEDVVIGAHNLILKQGDAFDEGEETINDYLNAGMSTQEAEFATSNCLDYDQIY